MSIPAEVIFAVYGAVVTWLVIYLLLRERRRSAELTRIVDHADATEPCEKPGCIRARIEIRRVSASTESES